MTEFIGYLDASGHPNDQPSVVVAGFIATKVQWLSFEVPWKTALLKYRLGNIFHMTDFEAEKRSDRATILNCLTNIINNHTTAHFSCAVEMSAYKKVNSIYALEETIGTPYAIAARGVTRNINLWKGKYFKSNDNLLIFVEQGTKHHGDMEEAFRRDSLPVPQKVPKDHPSVQPADLLGWEVRHYVEFRDNRRSLRKLIDHGTPLPEAHGTFREENLLYSCKVYPVPLRASLAANTQIVYHTSPKRVRVRTIK